MTAHGVEGGCWERLGVHRQTNSSRERKKFLQGTKEEDLIYRVERSYLLQRPKAQRGSFVGCSAGVVAHVFAKDSDLCVEGAGPTVLL